MSPEIAWRDNLSDARQEAEKRCKPIFVDWADLPSCVGFVSLENNTYPQKDVIDFVRFSLRNGREMYFIRSARRKDYCSTEQIRNGKTVISPRNLILTNILLSRSSTLTTAAQQIIELLAETAIFLSRHLFTFTLHVVVSAYFNPSAKCFH